MSSQEIYKFLKANSPTKFSVREISENLNISHTLAGIGIRRLRNFGFIKSDIAIGKLNKPFNVYFVLEENQIFYSSEIKKPPLTTDKDSEYFIQILDLIKTLQVRLSAIRSRDKLLNKFEKSEYKEKIKLEIRKIKL